MQWKRNLSESEPFNNQRLLVSDGEVITFAKHIKSENHHNWFFENENLKGIDIDWWMEEPPLPPKILKDSK
jgi:hypothetical protein